MRAAKSTYDTLSELRNACFEQEYTGIDENIRVANEEHLLGTEFIQCLNTATTKQQVDKIRAFLSARNVGATGVYESRTLCLMDATGSMSHLLNQAKNTVGTMFERASLILREHGIAEDAFQMQFAVYRDYDCRVEELLQFSTWTTKPDDLRKFMEKVSARGGGDYEEAIEVALWHVNDEHSRADVSQVILIGDAPPKETPAIARDRRVHGESYWTKTPYKLSTHYLPEARLLGSNGVPVHAFYLHNGAKSKFEEIARITSGKCAFLDINRADGSELLTNIITEKILQSVGQSRGKGDELVNAYRSMFARTYA